MFSSRVNYVFKSLPCFSRIHRSKDNTVSFFVYLLDFRLKKNLFIDRSSDFMFINIFKIFIIFCFNLKTEMHHLLIKYIQLVVKSQQLCHAPRIVSKRNAQSGYNF